jgi:myo-inositol 2-dehydrogenase / D-chiro-inositol 1-dehydrogenase
MRCRGGGGARRLDRGRGARGDAILASDDIDAVVIGTPTDSHFDLIRGAARHGKAIFCEKPIDMSVDNIRACIDAVGARACPS